MDVKEKTIIICGIVRDAEKGLRRNIPVIDELCHKFKDFKIIIYENDSVDCTKELLANWHIKDPDRVHISLNCTDPSKTIPTRKTAGTANPFFSHKRIDKMVTLRNKYMAYVELQGWTADYLMVVDMDVAQLYLEPILTSFSRDDWDAVCSFGYSLSPSLRRRYHDTYALTEWGDQNNPQTEAKIKINSKKYSHLRNGDPWVRVASGFGGLAIYRFEAVNGLRYRVVDNDDLRVEVKCEHCSIFDQMMQRSYDRFYINPSMKLKYQSLGWEIVKNALMRFIGLN